VEDSFDDALLKSTIFRSAIKSRKIGRLGSARQRNSQYKTPLFVDLLRSR